MGNLTLQGATSGQITLAPTAVAGTNTITLPASTGTLALTASPIFSGTVTASTLTSPAATDLTIQSAGTTAMTIDTSRNVGIGTTNPQAVLDLGNSTAGRAITWGGTTGTQRYSSIFSAYSAGALTLATNTAGSTSADTYVSTYTGTVANNLIRLNVTGTGGIQFFTDGSSAQTAGSAFVPTERMRIDSSGNVGIGTSSPSTKLHVVGEVTATQGVGGYPAFHATAGGAQTVSNGVNTKITLTEDFDTNTDFSSSRFTPSVAGYYQINAAVWSNAGTSMSYAGALIYKNGSAYSLSYGAAYTSTSANGIVSDIVYLNGSTDYVELYGRVNGSGTLTINTNTYFSGCLIRGA